jgi:hypothetical protein
VQIPTSSGDAIEAWVYLPEGSGRHPAVVMAHGIGGIKAGGLAPFVPATLTREEHLLPLHVVVGAAGSDSGRRMLKDIVMGAVESAFQFG